MPQSSLIDLTGKTFDRLTVLRRDSQPHGSSHEAWWVCQCICGQIVSVRSYQLRKKQTRSCGCLSKQSPVNFLDLTGQRFERLTVLERDTSPSVSRWTAHWICQCVCGAIVSIPTMRLRNKGTRSCGCLMRELQLELKVTHGATRKNQISPEYRAWCKMKERCNCTTSKDYARWGGRGIRVCERWQNSFTAFLHDMGPRPTPKHTLERLDNNGPYSPENCIWATRTRQARNTRNTVFLTWNNETHCISEWSEIVPISQRTIAERYRAGWPVERILTTPPRRWPSQVA